MYQKNLQNLVFNPWNIPVEFNIDPRGLLNICVNGQLDDSEAVRLSKALAKYLEQPISSRAINFFIPKEGWGHFWDKLEFSKEEGALATAACEELCTYRVVNRHDEEGSLDFAKTLKSSLQTLGVNLSSLNFTNDHLYLTFCDRSDAVQFVELIGFREDDVVVGIPEAEIEERLLIQALQMDILPEEFQKRGLSTYFDALLRTFPEANNYRLSGKVKTTPKALSLAPPPILIPTVIAGTSWSSLQPTFHNTLREYTWGRYPDRCTSCKQTVQYYLRDLEQTYALNHAKPYIEGIATLLRTPPAHDFIRRQSLLVKLCQDLPATCHHGRVGKTALAYLEMHEPNENSGRTVLLELLQNHKIALLPLVFPADHFQTIHIHVISAAQVAWASRFGLCEAIGRSDQAQGAYHDNLEEVLTKRDESGQLVSKNYQEWFLYYYTLKNEQGQPHLVDAIHTQLLERKNSQGELEYVDAIQTLIRSDLEAKGLSSTAAAEKINTLFPFTHRRKDGELTPTISRAAVVIGLKTIGVLWE